MEFSIRCTQNTKEESGHTQSVHEQYKLCFDYFGSVYECWDELNTIQVIQRKCMNSKHL